MKTRTFNLALTIGSLALSAVPSLAQTTYESYTFITLAGSATNSGSADETGSSARFNFSNPFAGGYGGGVAVDGAGNLYVADTGNFTIRKVTPAGVVTTLAGLAQRDDNGWPVFGSADGTGSGARFGGYGVCGAMGDQCPVGPYGLAADSAGNLYVADTGNNTIRKGYPAPIILTAGADFGFTNVQFGFNLIGQVGQRFIIEASIDLVNWLPTWTNTFSGNLHFADPQSNAYSNRFYRFRLP